MTGDEIRQRFLGFFEKHGHAVVKSSSLLPGDPSVLLTTAGMQQFKPYYTGEADPQKDFGSKNTCSVQKSFRTSDIEEVGDERHLTFFEMLGNFSFGGYGKEEAIKLAHEFITNEMNLPIDYVTIFKGSGEVPKDEESKKIWENLGVKDVREEGMDDVFWGPTGSAGPCGPTTEIYCKNGAGEAIEVWNLVFNQFYFPGTREELLAGNSGKKLELLKQFGVDTGMGLERLAMIAQKTSNIFETDLFKPLIDLLPADLPVEKKGLVADHARACTFLIADGVRPDNKGAGYILRRLLRRALAQIKATEFELLVDMVIKKYQAQYPELNSAVFEVVKVESEQFSLTLEQGLKELKKLKTIDVPAAFHLYQTYGLPFDVIKDYAPDLDQKAFEAEFKKHQEVSRQGLEKKFAGGLADHEPATIKLHTAHHLLLAALQQVLGKSVKQRGSNITGERLRIDFSFDRKLTPEELVEVEKIVNEKIKEDLPVENKKMPKVEAEKLGAQMEFGQKYGETVSVYIMGEFSKEFCGGPHVAHTSELGKFKIKKEEAVAAGIRRIKAVLLDE